MIEGLKIKVSSAELKSHIETRAAYHQERAVWYEGQVVNLRSGGVRPEAVSNDPASSLERSAKDHKEKAALFSFMADHIIPNEEYILSENDLSRIELVSRYF
jgi:hypothetical protein